MILQKLQEELLQEKVHKFFRDQSFFKGVKNYLPEMRKLIIEFFNKKGYDFSSEKYSYSDSDEDVLDKSRHKQPLSSEERNILKQYGFKDTEINSIPKTTLKFDGVLSIIKKFFTYKVNNVNDPDEVKVHLDNLSTEERETLMSSINSRINKEKEDAYKKTLGSTEVEQSFFGAENERYKADMILPKMRKEGYEIKVKFMTNEEFFVEGHNMILELKRESETKKYKFKVNMMRKVEEVLSNIEKNIQDGMKKYEKGVESDPKEKNSAARSMKLVKSDPERIVNNYFSKWYSTTKTGKLREVSTDRMPAEVVMRKERSRSSGYSSLKSPMKDDVYVMYLKVKGSKMKYETLKKENPDIVKWHAAYTQAMEMLGYPSYKIQSDPSQLFGDKIFTDEHEKFFERLKFVIKKLAAEGWIPIAFSTAHKRGDSDSITFRYDENIKKEYSENPEQVAEKLFNSDRYKNAITNGIMAKGTSMKDIQRIYVKKILTTKPRK